MKDNLLLVYTNLYLIDELSQSREVKGLISQNQELLKEVLVALQTFERTTTTKDR